MTSTVTFPRKKSTFYLGTGSTVGARSRSNTSINGRYTPTQSIDMSVVSRHATALEVCDFVYGSSHEPSFLDAAELFYEANAMYENPFITATSRSIISDIYALSRQFTSVAIPRPLAMLYTLLRLRPPDIGGNPVDGVWFEAVRVWNEIGEVSETETFDGQRKSIVEHTLNILFLPDIHQGSEPALNSNHIHPQAPSSMSSSTSLYASCGYSPTSHHPLVPQPPSFSSLSLPVSSTSYPSLPIPYTALSIPSPFHLRLPIHTRLSFNESGLITYHRDIWDMKDVVGLVPGVSLLQWVSARLIARGVARLSRIILRRGISDRREWIHHRDKEPLGDSKRELLTGPGISRREKDGTTKQDGDENEREIIVPVLPSETYRVHAQQAHAMEQHMLAREKRAVDLEHQARYDVDERGKAPHHPSEQMDRGAATYPKWDSRTQRASVSGERMGTEEV